MLVLNVKQLLYLLVLLDKIRIVEIRMTFDLINTWLSVSTIEQVIYLRNAEVRYSWLTYITWTYMLSHIIWLIYNRFDSLLYVFYNYVDCNSIRMYLPRKIHFYSFRLNSISEKTSQNITQEDLPCDEIKINSNPALSYHKTQKNEENKIIKLKWLC